MRVSENQSTALISACGENCWMGKFSSDKNCAHLDANDPLSETEIKEMNKGDFLIRKGDPVSGIYCIKNGHVKIHKKGRHNKEFIVWIAGKGDVIGFNSFSSGESYAFSATAIEKTSACFISNARLKSLLKQKPTVLAALLQMVCRKIDFIEQRITSLSGKGVRAQCAEILLTLADPCNIENPQNLCINYSVKELASLVGTSRNYLYKILMEFVDSGVLSVTRRRLTIRNPRALLLIAVESDKSTS